MIEADKHKSINFPPRPVPPVLLGDHPKLAERVAAERRVRARRKVLVLSIFHFLLLVAIFVAVWVVFGYVVAEMR
jgi:hypothetical protein